MKFNEFKYVRPDMDKIDEKSKKLTGCLRNAVSPSQALDIFYEYQTLIFDFNTMSCLSMIRHTIDTKDEFYAKEYDYMDDAQPLFDMLKQEFYKALSESKHRAELENELGGLLFKNIDILLKTISPDIIPDLQEENRLVSEYIRLCSSARVTFEGNQYTFSQFEAYKQDSDRSRRQAAWEADGKASLAIGDELDKMFSDLVTVRTKIAKKLGYENFIELGYYRMNRNCYGQKEVEAFREGVLKYIVPVSMRLKEEQKKRLEVDRLTMADAFILFKDGNPKPKGTPDDIFQAAREMYQEMSPLTGEFFEFMFDNELFDILSKDNKAGGGYCDYLWNYKAPFIFANFNGTQDDVEVLTHEAGHALCDYLSRDMKIANYVELTSETAEVHSMSMEFFTRPWMENFFHKDKDKFLYAQLADPFNSIPYMCIVDEFQHIIYSYPEMTPKERHETYRRLEEKYRPWLDLDEIPFYKDGRRWQRQLHIYEVPFYYIDYALAMTMALQFWTADLADHEDAWDRYLTFVKAAGTRTFTDLIQDSGMKSPFWPETLKHVSDTVTKWLDEHQNI